MIERRPTDDCFRAGGSLWRILTEDKKQLLVRTTVTDIAPVTENIKYRHAAPATLPTTSTAALRKSRGLDMDKVVELSKLSNDELNKATTGCCKCK